MFRPVPTEAVIFDAYGTLFNVSGIQQRLETHFGHRAAAVNALWRRKQLEYTWLRSLMGVYRPFSQISRDALAYACAAEGLELTPDRVSDLMEHYNYLPLYPEVEAALDRLTPTFRLGVLSNADPAMLLPAIEHAGLADRFDAVYSADTLRRYKPYPGIYGLPVRHLQVRRSELLFVSSNTWDVAGAKAAGLRVAWVRRGVAPMDQLQQWPDHILDSLAALPEALGLPLIG